MPEDHENPDRTGSETDAGDGATEQIRPDQQPSTDSSGQPAGSQESTRPGLSVPDGAATSSQATSSRGESSEQSGSSAASADAESDSERTQTIPVVDATGTAAGAQSSSEPSSSDRPDSAGSRAGDESDSERTQTIPAVTDAPTTASQQPPGPPQGFASPEDFRTQTMGAVPPAPTAGVSHSGDLFGGPQQAGPHSTGTQPAVGQPAGAQFGGGQPPFGQTTAAGQDDGDAADRSERNRRSLIRAGLVAGIAAGALLLLYIADLAFSSGQVPRGTVVAGVDVGGMEQAAAERKLRTKLEPGLDDPIKLRVGKATATIEPERAGLSMDWNATLDKAGSQPLNPFTRVSSFFTSRPITPVSHVRDDSLVAALKDVKPELHRDPVEGTIRFDGSEPKAVMPVTGRSVNIDKATEVVIAQWAGQQVVELPYTTQPVSTTPEGVRKALEQVAEPAVSESVTVTGDGVNATLTPTEIARSLRFEPDGKGGLKWHVDVPSATEAVKPELASSLKKGRDASMILQGGKPVVQPSVKGRGVDWKKTFAPLRKVLTQAEGGSVKAVYVDKPAKVTTKEVKALGIKEKVSTFTTKGFSKDSGVNIRRVAQEVNGAIVKPGETFSLNQHTGIRQKPQGYIASGIIKDGRPAKAVGGGISQFATTLYNASYFAGMKDIEHSEHSYYISRYPMAREATVFQKPDGTSIIDVKFKNVSDSGILIQTHWTPESITVTFWGTKQYDVKSKTGPKTNPTKPKTTTVPPDKKCIATKGKPGFTVYDTRIRTNIKTGEVTKTREKAVYEPQPVVKCAPKPPPPPR